MKRICSIGILCLLAITVLFGCAKQPLVTSGSTTTATASATTTSFSGGSFTTSTSTLPTTTTSLIPITTTSSTTVTTTTTLSVSDQMQQQYSVVFGETVSSAPTFLGFVPLADLPSGGEQITVSPTADDLRVIADRYNTGCRGEETFTVAELGGTYGGLVLSQGSNGFGFSAYMRENAALLEDNTFVFENIDFTAQKLTLMASSPNPDAKIKMIFNNCKIDRVSTARDGSIPYTYEFNDCTMTMFDGSNATFRRCLFTGSSYYDGMNPFQNVYAYDCAILDKAPITYDKEMHTDGIQIYGYYGLEADNLHFDNLRVELPIVSYTDSLSYTNTPLMVSLDYNNARNISFTNCVVNGGGFTVTLYDNPKHKDGGYYMTEIYLGNIRAGASSKYGIFSKAFGKTVMDEDVIIEDLLETSTLYVASVWQEEGKTHFSVSNDTSVPRHLVIMTDRGTYEYLIPACPLHEEVKKDTFYASFPFDIDLAIDEACSYAVLYDVTDGTYRQIRSFSAEDDPIVLDGARFVAPALDPHGLVVKEGRIGNGHLPIWWCLYRDGTLIITGEGALGNYAPTTVGNRRIQAYAEQIKRVIIRPGITSIGSAFFCGFVNMEEISIPATVKSIGKYAFQGCSSLRSVTLPMGVETIGEYAFNFCSSLTSFHVPSSVTSLAQRVFANCSSLVEITVGCPTEVIGNSMFDGCTSLTTVTLPATVTSVGARAFYRCTSLTTVRFAGTEEQYTAIAVEAPDGYNKNLTAATVVTVDPSELTRGDVVMGQDDPVIPELEVRDTLTKVYDGTPVESVPFFYTNSDGQVTVYYAEGALQLDGPPTVPGRYTLIIDVAATDVHKAARATVSFFIYKITPTLDVPSSVEVDCTGREALAPAFTTDSNAKPVLAWYDGEGNALPATPMAPGSYVLEILLPETDTYYQVSKRVSYVIRAVGGWDGTLSDTLAGEGTEIDPYRIGSAGDLALLSALLADEATYETYASAYYKLTADIELNAFSEFFSLWGQSAPSCAWTPIGLSDEAPFRGHFDGDGHTVYGLYINDPTCLYPGLFGYLEGATVSDLTLRHAYVSNQKLRNTYAGILAGFANLSVIDSVSVLQAEVYSFSYAGGILGGACGVTNQQVTLSGCSFDGKVEGGSFAGGLVGFAKIHGCSILVTDATVSGSVMAKAGAAAGIVAVNSTNPRLTLDGCVVTASVTSQNAEAGGMISRVYYTTGYVTTVRNSTFSGTVSGATCAGGIVAKADGTSGNIRVYNCVSEGQVTAPIAGGLFGLGNAGRRDALENVYISATVSGETAGALYGQLTAAETPRLSTAGVYYHASIGAVAGVVADPVEGWDEAYPSTLAIAVSDAYASGEETDGDGLSLADRLNTWADSHTTEDVTYLSWKQESAAPALCH